jgi:hypothetical protein
MWHSVPQHNALPCLAGALLCVILGVVAMLGCQSCFPDTPPHHHHHTPTCLCFSSSLSFSLVARLHSPSSRARCSRGRAGQENVVNASLQSGEHCSYEPVPNPQETGCRRATVIEPLHLHHTVRKVHSIAFHLVRSEACVRGRQVGSDGVGRVIQPNGKPEVAKTARAAGFDNNSMILTNNTSWGPGC